MAATHRADVPTRSGRRSKTSPVLGLIVLLAACSGGGGGGGGDPDPDPDPRLSRSGPIQLSSDQTRLFVVNKVGSDLVPAGRGSLSVVRVRDAAGADAAEVLAEIPVGVDPYSVSVTDDDRRLFVSNGADGTVSVIDLGEGGKGPYTYVTDLAVGSEPRGTAVHDDELFVANFGDGSVTVLGTDDLLVRTTLRLGAVGNEPAFANPHGLLAAPNGEVWVTDFYAVGAAGKGVDAVEGFDDGKEARVGLLGEQGLKRVVRMRAMVESGFTADRTAFDPANGAANATFRAPAGVDPTRVPQGAFFNQLFSLAYDEDTQRLFVPAIGAAPAPPVRFNVNVQSLVGVVQTADATTENVEELTVSLNAQVLANFGDEPGPTPPFTPSETRLDRAFAADVVAMDVRSGTVVLPSRAGSFLLVGFLGADGSISLARNLREAIVRIPTTNLPAGVVLDDGATRAYVASDLVGEVSVVDLTRNVELGRIETAASPTDPKRRRELLGQLAFFTGMGLAADTAPGTDPRDVDTHRFRNMASNGNWSSCASCHPGGRADGVTWLFPTGPRQSISLEGFFAHGSTVASELATTDQKISNWNGVRGSITDFNNNARNVQGGFGFTPEALATIDAGQGQADVPDAGLVFNQGPRLGVSNALDLMTEWVASIRPLSRPTDLDDDAVARGRTLFAASCSACHAGSKWTNSTRVLDLALWPDPAFEGGLPRGDNLFNPAASAIVAFDADDDGDFETRLVDAVVAQGTLDLTNPIEIRGLGGQIGLASAGLAVSFVPPSLFGVRNSAPYGHHGRAATLEDVFVPVQGGGLGHPDFGLNAQELADVLEFVRAIDGAQPTVQATTLLR